MWKENLDKIMVEKILVVEDEPVLLETLVYNLDREGYNVIAVDNGIKALEIARKQKPDLMVLDIMLPGLDGFDVTRILRQEMNLPILILTARDDEIDRVLGLELGADDYLTKPFSMRELLARVKAQLRRVKLIQKELNSESDPVANVLEFSNLIINLTRREILLDDKVLTLKPKEFDLLTYFGKHKGQVLTRDALLEKVWGWDFTGGSRTVDVHIRWLREKIEPDPANPTRIITVRGVGYRFEG
jgi:DNA-binding response OmpR family regulator